MRLFNLFQSLWPDDAVWYLWTVSSLVMFVAKLMLIHYQLDPIAIKIEPEYGLIVQGVAIEITVSQLLVFLSGPRMWTHCGPVTPCGGIWVNIGSSNCLLPDGTKPYYLNQCWFSVKVLYVTLKSSAISREMFMNLIRSMFWDYTLETTAKSPRAIS